MTNDMTEARIAILGATGYIGRSLLAVAYTEGLNIVPFSRDPQRAKKVLSRYEIKTDRIDSYDQLLDQEFDIVVNATGIGSPRKIAEDPKQVSVATEAVDKILYRYLEKRPTARVFSVSSGSVCNLSKKQTRSNLSPGDQYAFAKLSSEERHRSWSDYSVIDLRVFAFVSRWLDPEEKFFIAEVAKCLLEDRTLSTMSNDMIRDYATADDLWNVIEFLSAKEPMNTAFDMRSLAPISKFELLDCLQDRFGLKYEITQGILDQSPTGKKDEYYSQAEALSKLGYEPVNTSMQNIEMEINALLESKNN